MEYIPEYVEEKERVISLRNMMLYLWDKIVFILLVGLVIGCFFGIRNYKGQKNINPYAQKQSTINAIINQNKSAYYNRTTENKPYTYAEPPVGSFNSISRIYLDYNFEKIENNTNMDYTAMIVRAHNDAIQLIVSEEALQDVIDNLNLHSYVDMSDITPGELRWMISGYSDGTGILQLTVTDNDPERAKLIAEETINRFLQNINQYEFIDEARLIDSPSLPKGTGQVLGVNVNKKIIFKSFIIGFAGGAGMMVMLFILIFILVDTVRDRNDLEYVGAKCFGVIKKRNNSEDYKRIANNIVLSPNAKIISFIPTDKYSERLDVVSNIVNELEKLGKSVILIDKTDINDIEKNINSNKDKTNYIIIKSSNIRDYGEANIFASYSDTVIGISMYEKTKLNGISFAVKELSRVNNKLEGFIISSAKHI